MSASGLGPWASSAMRDAINAVGFSPADLSARKAVLVNSEHVLRADESTFSARLLSAKEMALSSGGNSGLSGVLFGVEASASSAIGDLSSEFTVATIALFDGVIEVPITISLPRGVADGLSRALQSGISALKEVVASVTGVRQWE